jgi:protein gp37
MSANTGIEWTDSTWNPIRGCTRVSEGCRNCYAEKVAYRFSGAGQPYEGLAVLKNGHASWTGKIQFVQKHLLDPLKWKTPRRIFVNSMSDLFHEGVTDETRDKIFAVMALAHQHTFQVLTKRPYNMLRYLTDKQRGARWLYTTQEVIEKPKGSTIRPWDVIDAKLGNVWLGVSVENQAAADERIPLLLKTPAAVRFLSCEPLLGPVSLRWKNSTPFGVAHPRHLKPSPDEDGRICTNEYDGLRELDWVICGGESGPGARPMHPDWARTLRDQCVAAGVPFFFKQWGEFSPEYSNHAIDAHYCAFADQTVVYRVGKKAAGALLDGVEHKAFPEVR